MNFEPATRDHAGIEDFIPAEFSVIVVDIFYFADPPPVVSQPQGDAVESNAGLANLRMRAKEHPAMGLISAQ